MNRPSNRELGDMERAKTYIEQHYMERNAGETYFVNEDLRQDWSKSEIKQIEKYWKQGMNIYQIAELMDADDPDEIFLVIFDRARRGSGKRVAINHFQLYRGTEQ